MELQTNKKNSDSSYISEYLYSNQGIGSVDIDFDTIWRKYIKPLEGQRVFTATGRENIILSVTDKYLQRISSKGRTSKVDIKIFESVFHKLLEKKVLTRKEIHTEHPTRVSSIVTAVLAKVPFIKLSDKRPITLIVRR